MSALDLEVRGIKQKIIVGKLLANEEAKARWEEEQRNKMKPSKTVKIAPIIVTDPAFSSYDDNKMLSSVIKMMKPTSLKVVRKKGHNC